MVALHLLLIMAISAILIFPTLMDAHALPVMRLTADGNPGSIITITDNSAFDSSPLDGVIIYAGPVGDFIVTVNTGFSKPLIGDQYMPELDISVDALTGIGPGLHFLEVEFSDTDFDNTVPLSMKADVTGDPEQSVELEIYQDDGNAYFERTTLVYTTGELTELTAISDPFTIFPTGDYSLTAVITVTNDCELCEGSLDADLFTIHRIVAGEFLAIDNMSLLTAGIQSQIVWFVPIVASGIGITLFQIKKKYF